MTTIFRAPLIAPVSRPRPTAAAFNPPNLLLTTLIATIPFQNIEWPLPARAAYVHREFDPPNPISGAPPSIPFFDPLWPNPALPRAKVAAFDPPNLVTTVLVVDPPFRNIEWPKPVLRPPKALSFDPPFAGGISPAPPIPPDVVSISGGTWGPLREEPKKKKPKKAVAKAVIEEPQIVEIAAVPMPDAGLPAIQVTQDDDDEDAILALLLGI